MEWRELRKGNRLLSRCLHVLCHCPGRRSCLSFCMRIFNTSTSTHVQCSRGNRKPPLLACDSHNVYTKLLVPSRSVGFRTYLAIVRGGYCTCLAIVPVSGVRSQRWKISPKISQISRDNRPISWRSEIDRPKVLKEAGCSQSVRKLLFPFARARAKCGRNGPSMHTHGVIRLRPTPKVLRLRSSFGRAGETKFALKWVGRTDRARNKALWTH